MYIDSIEIENFRTFKKTSIDFVHRDRNYTKDFPKPILPNVNLLLGNNSLGKTTLLKAIALACLGPAVGRSGIYPYRLIRSEPTRSAERSTRRPSKARARVARGEGLASIQARFLAHPQDRVPGFKSVESHVGLRREGDLEALEWQHPDEKLWHPIFSSYSDAFFFVGYGATRRVEQKEKFDSATRRSRSFVRAQRIQSLFEDTYSLVPLTSWLPEYESRNKGRYVQVGKLINRLVGANHYIFTGEMDQSEYLFEKGRLRIPFPALSDGYQAFLGWVGDLLYHVCMTCPKGTKLVDNRGIVMVDEIDLHLHPRWQMTILPTLAAALPNIQFIVTSHSPVLVGSLQWMNIIVMREMPGQASIATRIPSPVHGLDADQVLLTDFFGMQSTRAPQMARRLRELTLRARTGDSKAAQQLLAVMSKGMESLG